MKNRYKSRFLLMSDRYVVKVKELMCSKESTIHTIKILYIFYHRIKYSATEILINLSTPPTSLSSTKINPTISFWLQVSSQKWSVLLSLAEFLILSGECYTTILENLYPTLLPRLQNQFFWWRLPSSEMRHCERLL